MKTFLMIIIVSVTILAQIPDAYFYPVYSIHNEFSVQPFTYSQTHNCQLCTFQINNNSCKKNFNTGQRMDSIIANSMSGYSSKLLFEYDENDNFKNQIKLTRTSEFEWEFYSKYEYFYDETLNLILRLDFGWNENEWDTLARINYEYNEQGLLSQNIYQIYTSNSWENNRKTTYQYDSFGNEIQRLIERWDNGWGNQYLHTNFFSNFNRRDSLLFQVWNSTNWENNSRTTFFYDQQTQFLESFLTKLWIEEMWKNSLKRDVTNDQNGNQILQLDKYWSGSEWEDSIKRYFTYDDLNYVLTAYCELWNGNQWYSDDGDIWIMNPDGFISLFNVNNVSIYYKTTGIIDDLNSEPVSFILYQNYPNPFNSTTLIKYTIPQSGDVTLKVFDLLGNEISILVDNYRTAGSYEVIFQAENLSSGIYFYQLQADDFIATKKLILFK